MPKAYWKGYQVFQIGEICGGWVKISFYCNYYESPLTGTGCCWALLDDITVEEE